MNAPKRFCFAEALLPFGAIGKSHAHCTHLQIAQANALTENCKRACLFYNAFMPTRKTKSGQC